MVRLYRLGQPGGMRKGSIVRIVRVGAGRGSVSSCYPIQPLRPAQPAALSTLLQGNYGALTRQGRVKTVTIREKR